VVIEEDQLDYYKNLSGRLRVIFDGFVEYVESNFKQLPFSGGFMDQPRAFRDMVKLSRVVEKQCKELKESG